MTVSCLSAVPAMPPAHCDNLLPGADRPADAVPVKTRGAGTATRQVNGFGVLTAEVSDGDVVPVPNGYHGPCVAAPGARMYHLDVLAGRESTGRWHSATRTAP